MSYQTFTLFNLPLNKDFLCFVFFGTLCSYNFHWYFTPFSNNHSEKVKWSHANRKLHLFIFFISSIAAVCFAYSLLQHWQWLLVTVLITFLYSAPKLPLKPFGHLKRIAIGKTIFLAFAWTHVTSILPVIFSGTAWTLSLELFAVNRFFLIYPICILFDYRDKHEDIKDGIRSMITHFDDAGIDILFWGSLAAFVVTLGFVHFLSLNLFQTIILALPAILLALLYSSSKKRASDYRFYFVLDGLMMLSGLLFLLLHFI